MINFCLTSYNELRQGFDEYYRNNHRLRHVNHQQRPHHRHREERNSVSLGKTTRLVPPPDDGDKDGQKDKIATRRGSTLQSRLESLKSTTTTAAAEAVAKQSIARKRWFDAFDHVCRQLNEVFHSYIS